MWESTAAKQATVPIVPQVNTKIVKEKRPANHATSTLFYPTLANHPKPTALPAMLKDRLAQQKAIPTYPLASVDEPTTTKTKTMNVYHAQLERTVHFTTVFLLLKFLPFQVIGDQAATAPLFHHAAKGTVG